MSETPASTENGNTNGNANTTGDSVPVSVPEALTLAEAAERLSITLPRLTRLLKRAEFAPGVSQVQRATKTGTRTVTLVSVSVIEAVLLSLTEQKHKQYGPNRYRSPEGEGRQEEERDAGQLSPLVAALLTEQEARLAASRAEIVLVAAFYERLILEKDTRLAEMAEALAHEREQSRRQADAPAREQGLRALLPHAEEARVSAWKRFKGWFGGN